MRHRFAIPLVVLATVFGAKADQSRLSATGSAMMTEEALEEGGSRGLVLRFYHDLNHQPADLSRAEHAIRSWSDISVAAT